MNHRFRFASIFTAAVLCSAITAPAFAADPPPSPSWNHYSWDIPVLQGLYMPSDGGTLGSLALGFTNDAAHIFGGATFFFDANGHPVTQAIGGQVHFNDDATVAATGIIATTDIASYSIDNGPCRGCADHGRDQVQTSDVAKFEWTGPRGGRYTVNGKTQSMVEAVSGPPLVGPTDYSGQWVMVGRSDSLYYSVTPNTSSHRELTTLVNLRAIMPTPVYQTGVAVSPGIAPIGSVPLPPPGVRVYDVTCVSPGCNLGYFVTTARTGTERYALWIGDDGAGRLLTITVSGGVSTVFDLGTEYGRMYATLDKIVGRQPLMYPNSYQISEIGMFRLGTGIFDGTLMQPLCSAYPQATPCNPGNH